MEKLEEKAIARSAPDGSDKNLAPNLSACHYPADRGSMGKVWRDVIAVL